MVGKEIAVELKNDVVLTGTLHSVDQYLNVKLLNVKVINPDKYPQLVALKNCFVRGSVVRYIQIPPEHVGGKIHWAGEADSILEGGAAATTLSQLGSALKSATQTPRFFRNITQWNAAFMRYACAAVSTNQLTWPMVMCHLNHGGDVSHDDVT